MKPAAFKNTKPEETHGFPKANPDETLAFAFAFALPDQEPRSRSTAFGGESDLWKCGNPKIKPTPRPTVGFRQLCAITKEQFQPDGGWKDAVMSRVTQLGFATPDPDDVRKAIDAVDHAHRLSLLPKAQPARMVIAREPRPIGRQEAVDILANLATLLARRSV